MCGRFAFDADYGQLRSRFDATAVFSGVAKHYNITPGMMLPIIVRHSPNTAVLAKWGLVPFWAKDPKIGYKMINARAEGIEAKPAFRKPFKTQRCLVPATGFFEWKKLEKEKIPYFIRLTSQNLFAFAGLYDAWKDAEGRELLTFTIITTAPNTLMEPIHNRMPVILSEEDENTWLDPDVTETDRLTALLDPYPARYMETHPVSKLVNNPENDSVEVLKPHYSGNL